MWDVIVVGAGPAGAVASFVLAGKGFRVLLIDASDPTVHRVGEALPGAALRILRSLDLPIPTCDGPHRPISGNLSSWNSEELVPTDFVRDPDGPGWRLDRIRFDIALRESAVRSGVIFKNAWVRDVMRTPGSWQVSSNDGAVQASRWLIDATGRRAAIASRLGARRKRDAGLIALYALGKLEREFSLNRTVVEAVPRGWWYTALLPSGILIAGLHVRPHEALHIAANETGWRLALRETRHVSQIFSELSIDQLRPLDASGGCLDQVAGDRWIACGDAALSFDPLSSQGILSALYGGMKAGLAVATALSGDLSSVASYVSRLKEIRRSCLAHLEQAYKSETRWRSESFWSIFHRRQETKELADPCMRDDGDSEPL
jgi:flavin-dependent dehydrogenase